MEQREKIKDCCIVDEERAVICIRKSDKKKFNLPRKFSRKSCLHSKKGFSMKSSCAPYNGCISTSTNMIEKNEITGLSGGTTKKKRKRRPKYTRKTQPKLKKFLNKSNKNKQFEVYKNVKDAGIEIKYDTLDNLISTIKLLEYNYHANNYTHKRILLISLVLLFRLSVLKSKGKQKEFNLIKQYVSFIKSREKTTNETKKNQQFKFTI